MTITFYLGYLTHLERKGEIIAYDALQAETFHSVILTYLNVIAALEIHEKQIKLLLISYLSIKDATQTKIK